MVSIKYLQSLVGVYILPIIHRRFEDGAAYRFCEAVGIGGYAYIMALQLLGDNDLYMKAGRTDDHPATAYRIGLLKYLYSIEYSAHCSQGTHR